MNTYKLNITIWYMYIHWSDLLLIVTLLLFIQWIYIRLQLIFPNYVNISGVK